FARAMARHIPWVWGKTTPQQAIAVRERGSATALRHRIGELADSPGLVRVADLATRAALSAPTEGRALYAGLRAHDVPDEPVARALARGDPAARASRRRPPRRPPRPRHRRHRGP